ncbi:Trehalose/maltose import ATP-binding protein MalK [Thermoplasmatales archaeon]|nr:Trehalose/maltose import ATP-binding protein MalK [Thermoplasmatales archaeon]
MTSIDIKGISKNYGSIAALKNVNLSLNSNGCIGLLGPNGAGKTTLMKLITNIIKPSTGEVLINGTNVSADPSIALRTVGSIIEQPEFYTYLTAYETMMFVCRIKGGTKEFCTSEIDRVSNITEVKNFLNRKTGTYSRGMKQRLALAVALINNPDVIILDEPTFGLDPRGMADIRRTLNKIREERRSIILLSTHLISEVKELCDRVIIIDEGSIVYDSDLDDVKKSLRIRFYEPVSMDFTGKDSLIEDEGKTAIFSVERDTPNNVLIRDLVSRGAKIRDVEESSGIEEKYLSIVGTGSN